MTEESIRLRIWKGSVPIRFIHGDDARVLDVPRLTTLSHILHDEGVSGGRVLSSHLPVGLLYDLYAGNGLPWTVVGHTRNSMTRDECTSRDVMAWNALKQSEWLRQHSIRRIQNLTPQECTFFMESMSSLDFIPYWSIADRLLMNMKAYPVRLYALHGNHILQTWQIPIPPRFHGERTTIASMLTLLVPHMASLGPDMVDIVCHGVILSWDLRVADLLKEAHYVDGWLHLAMRYAKRQDTSPLVEHQIGASTLLNQTFQHLN